jgi:hypothetical protein
MTTIITPDLMAAIVALIAAIAAWIKVQAQQQTINTQPGPPSSILDAGGWARYLGPILRRNLIAGVFIIAALAVAVLMLKPLLAPRGALPA